METEDQIMDVENEEKSEIKHKLKKASETSKEDTQVLKMPKEVKELKPSYKPSTPLAKNSQKSASIINKTPSLHKSNSSNNKIKSTTDVNIQSQLENTSKIEDISEYIDNYVAAAKNDKKQKEIENSQRERNHDWRRSKLSEHQSWNEKDLKVTPEMEEKRRKYLESLDQPVDEKMKWEHNKTLMQSFCRESDQYSLDNPVRIRTQLDKIKNSNLDNFPWDSEEQ